MTRLIKSLSSRSLKLPLTALAILIAALTILTTTSVTPALAADHVWTGVDFAWHGDLDPAAFKKAGVDFVVRYLSGGVGGGNKEITHAEADMWSKAGVGVVLVWETTASRAGQGYQAGYTDASKAYPQAASVGMPDGKPVYFAVDFDATGPQVDAYFRGIYDWVRTHSSDGQATYRIGVYGGHDVVQYIHDAGYAAYKWQALAWMHGNGWQADAMQQHRVDATVAGVSVDWNRAAVADYGVWFCPGEKEAAVGGAAAKSEPAKSEAATSTPASTGPAKTTPANGAPAKSRPLQALREAAAEKNGTYRA